MLKPLALAVLGLSCVTYGCAARVAKPASIASGTPYVSFVLMSGDRDNPDREFICQSDSRDECVVTASRPDEQIFSDAHFYYHGVGADTKYSGSIRIGYFRTSAESQQIQTNITVKKSESIANQSVVGIVTSTPGRYEIAFDLVAESIPPGTSHPIRTRLPVVVKN